MTDNKFSWVDTHNQITQYLSTKENSQLELIELLESVGIDPFNDKSIEQNEYDIRLDEIDPFTFFCYIYKYGDKKRLEKLQEIAAKLGIEKPLGESGIPSAQAQKVWLFPYKFLRVNNEISRLWSLFHKELKGQITDEDFEDALTIRSTGKTKLTEALFYVNPEKYLPINGPTKPYLKEELGIDSEFNTYSEYIEVLRKIKLKSDLPFYELSYEAWKWNKERGKTNYWIFQGNPKVFDFETALRNDILTDWTVSAHKDKIKVGDKVILWITGNQSGCYALAEVTSEPHQKTTSPDDHLWKGEDNSELKANIKITHNLVDNPVLGERFNGIEELKKLKVGNQGTNFSASEEEYLAILDLSQNKSEKQYWLYAPGEKARKWNELFSSNEMAIGWDNLGDLSQYSSKEQIEEALMEDMEDGKRKYNDALACYEFASVIKPGDIVITKKGKREYVGWGIVAGEYFYDLNQKEYKNRRKVNWKEKREWIDSAGDIVTKTLTDITKYPDYVKRLVELLGIEKKENIPMNDSIDFPLNTILYGPPGTGKTYNTIFRAAEIIENRVIDSYDEALDIFKTNLHNRIEFITFHQNYSYEDFIQGLRPETKEENEQLKFKKSDGVFKVIADRAFSNIKESEKAPEEMSQVNAFSEALEILKDKILESDEPIKINETAYFTAVEDDVFRYSGDNWTLNDKGFNGFRMKYSDLERFLEEGVKERKEIKNLDNISGLAKQHATYFIKAFELVKSLMPKNSSKTQKTEKKNYVIIIDEINRANISRVFGELITLIEPDKRSHGAIPLEARLPSGDHFIVPSNLFIIGTMNTADKSIALLDIALRRRFEFESMYPKYEIDGKEIYDVDILKKINEQIIKTKGHDFQIGHAYFMGENNDLVKRMNKKVIPLLLEYYMNDENEVKGILISAGLKIEEAAWPIKISGKND
jgi:5-methylcytosine-specific restriction enzyme B